MGPFWQRKGAASSEGKGAVPEAIPATVEAQPPLDEGVAGKKTSRELSEAWADGYGIFSFWPTVRCSVERPLAALIALTVVPCILAMLLSVSLEMTE
jgi:hypothetical protein